jgi:hypothetical protein
MQKAHFLETDTELEDAHSSAASGGDTAVSLSKLFIVLHSVQILKQSLSALRSISYPAYVSQRLSPMSNSA